jgi:predicted RNA-binding protein with PUA-like domain
MNGGLLMNYWLLKTEPDEYSWQDLKNEGNDSWDGVKGSGALKHMRFMKPGDKVFIYHTGKEKAIVGTATITREAYPDPDSDDGRLLVVDLEAGQALPKPVTLAEIKQSGNFTDWELVRQPRLSVMPVSKEQWDVINNWV